MAEEKSLWGNPMPISSAEEALLRDASILGKIKSPKEVRVRKAGISKRLPWAERERAIGERVRAILGKHEADTDTIYDLGEYERYVRAGIAKGAIFVDTETNNSLDPITCKLMGLCLWAEGEKQAYVPVNHVNPETGERLPSQLTEAQLKPMLEELQASGCRIVYHNATFDMRVIQCQVGIELRCDWDTMIAAAMIDENEEQSLKSQYARHIDPSHGKYDIEDLFEHERYENFKPELFALYAATDPMMTGRLYRWQEEVLNRPENAGVLKCYREIELPCIPVVKDMELRGVGVDRGYMERLKSKYHRILDEYQPQIDAELEKIRHSIDEWRSSEDGRKPARGASGKAKCELLEDPVNIESPAQLAIVLYDVLKLPPVSKDKPRSVDKNAVAMLLEKHDVPLLKVISERKKFKTLVQNFIDKIPEMINPKDGRVHCSFRQMGTATGRFSCSDPNLQQVPSRNHEIRLMFEATPGYVMIGSDFSGQEPRLLAQYTQDEHMMKAFRDGLDLYAFIGTKVYHNQYKDNLEFNPDTGERQEEGANRRSKCKIVQLAISYGMTVQSLAQSIKSSVPEAQKVLDSFYDGFPAIRKWKDATIAECHKNGYVEDWAGRRRRLADVSLPKYSVRSARTDFNPFLGCGDREIGEKEKAKWLARLAKCRGFSDSRNVIDEALSSGVRIESNVSRINAAERQCVNARVQGGAASMTKRAMAIIANDPEMRRLGFRLLIQVHDELIGEAPERNAKEAADRLTYLMSHCMDGIFNVPFKCDADVSKHWYWNVYSASLRDELSKMVRKGVPEAEARERIVREHDESTPEQVRRALDGDAE